MEQERVPGHHIELDYKLVHLEQRDVSLVDSLIRP